MGPKWSLNWDCVQESAFENVGIKREAVDAQLPWPTSFKALITAHDCAEMGEAHGVKILKPHGCVMALVRAKDAEKRGDRCCAMHLSERFLITESELKELQPRPGMDGTQHFIFANLSAKLCTQPCIVAGWSAGEKYLLDYFEQHVRPVLELRQLAVDELSIVDIPRSTTKATYGLLASTGRMSIRHTSPWTQRILRRTAFFSGCRHSTLSAV